MQLLNLQLVFYLVMCILWTIVCVIQFVIALLAWIIWRYIRALVEQECYQSGDSCFCNTDKPQPIPGKLEKRISGMVLL